MTQMLTARARSRVLSRAWQGVAVICCALAAGLFARAARAHEFWIEPHAYQIAPGEPIIADLKVGQKFRGAVFPFFPRDFRRFDIRTGDRLVAVEGRMGDLPALNMPASAEGLTTIIHVTRDYTLTYPDFARFEAFARHKDFAWAIAATHERGIDTDLLRERYSRHAKSLVAVGHGRGHDRPEGLRIEIVALENPYTDDVADGVDVQLFLEGAPRADAQIELFERAPDGTVTITLHRTDAEGRATLPVRPGHEYLVDSVALTPLEMQTPASPAWESIWASLTFKVPE